MKDKTELSPEEIQKKNKEAEEFLKETPTRAEVANYVNSLLEEIFFRGLIFHAFDNRLISYLVSGISFSLYHLSMIANWGNAFIFVLMLVLLFIASVVLQIFSLHFKSLKASYLVHAMSNLAINSLGFYIIYFM